MRLPRAKPPVVRLVNVALGVWLFSSAFLWPHTSASFANTWMIGAMLAVAGVFAYRSPAGQVAQMICGAIAGWLVLSTLVIAPRTELTFWHNLVVGVLALGATFAPARRRARTGSRARHGN